VVIDIGPDFRSQALRAEINHLSAVFLTHEHNDHIAGLDDLRPFIFKSKKSMPIYGEQRVLDSVRERFSYAFTQQPFPGAPSFDLRVIAPGDTIEIGSISLEVIRLFHGGLPTLGYVIQDQVAYCTDTNHISDEVINKIHGLPIVILDMLHRKRHYSHNNFDEALIWADRIGAQRTFLIHMSHLMGPTSTWEQSLPRDIFPAYDTLSFDLN